MYYRTECEHEMKEDAYHGSYCAKCKLRSYQIGKDANLLTAAEKKYGPFGARKAMFKLIEDTGGLNHFMLMDKDGKWLAYALGAACYYQLMQHHGADKTRMIEQAEFIWDWPFRGSQLAQKKSTWKRCGGAKGWASQYYNWMANKSPFADAFVVKDWKQAFTDGILYKTDFEAHALMAVMSGVRYIGEFPRIPKAWAEAKKHTDNGMMALLAAHHLHVGEDGLAHTETHKSNHAMWNDTYFDAEQHTKNMLEGRLLKPKDSGTMRKKWAWNNCIQIFGKSAKNADYWDETPKGKHRFTLPETGGKQVRDMFGGIYTEYKNVPVAEWMDQFEEEVMKWELKSPS